MHLAPHTTDNSVRYMLLLTTETWRTQREFFCPIGRPARLQSSARRPRARAGRCRADWHGGLGQTDTHRLILYFFGTGSAALNSQITRFGDLSARITKRSEDVDRLKATRQAGCPDRLIGTNGKQRGSKISLLIFDPLCSQ